MEDRAVIAIVVIVGAVFLTMHTGHIGAIVSGNNQVPAVQTPVSVGSAQPATANPSDSTGAGNVRTIALKSIGGRYDPAVIEVKKGTTVRIMGDPQTLSGCMEVVNIEGYGISKRISSGDNIIEFTADRTGTFPIYCNMGIGNGKLVVDA